MLNRTTVPIGSIVTDDLREIESVIAAAPLFQPRMPKTGKPFSVEMTNCGPIGWVSEDGATGAS